MPTLNDSRLFFRIVVLAQGLPPGIILGALLGQLGGGDLSARFLVALLASLVVQVVVGVVLVVVTRQADAAIQHDVARCTRELVEGVVPLTAPVPARVVRSRVARQHPGGVVDLEVRPPGRLDRAGRIVVLGAVPVAAPPRRVALLAPNPAAAMLTTGSIHLVHLHPEQPEAALLNVRAEPGRLQAAQHDPLWSTVTLPTDRSISGGWLAGTAFTLLGVALGAALGLALALA